VYAGEPGTVVWSGWMTGLGNTVILALQDGTQVVFGHLSTLALKRGDQAGAGQLLGASGNSGNSTGDHLHFEIRTPSTGQPIDPVAWLANHLDRLGLGGTQIGAQATGDPSARSPLDIPGAIGDAVAAVTKSLTQIAFMVLGLLLFIVGLWLTVRAEGGRIPVPSHINTPLRVVKGAKEAIA